MKKIKRVFTAALWLCLLSCHHPQNETAETTKIDFFAATEDFHQLNILSGNTLIPLKEGDNKEFLLKQLDKVVVKNCTIYVADTYMKQLFVYDMEGNPLGKVGKKGEGPNEYLTLSDFCVADNGHIYWYDGIKNCVQVYDKALSLLNQYEVPFHAECLQSVNGGFVFALAPYNDDPHTQNQCLAYTDTLFNVTETALQYSDNIDPNVEFYSPFISSRNGVLYNRVINNHVYRLNENGIAHCYVFDFADRNVPDKYLKALDELMESNEKYCYLATTPLLLGDLFVGCLNQDGNLCTFVHDLKSGNSYVKQAADYNLNSLNLPVALSDDGRIVSYLNSELYPAFEADTTLSAAIKQTLKEEGFILCLSRLR